MVLVLSKEDEDGAFIVVDLSRAWNSPIGQRTKKAVDLVRKAVMKKFDASQVKIEPDLNSKIWSRSRSKPPRRVKIRVTVEDDIAHVEPG